MLRSSLLLFLLLGWLGSSHLQAQTPTGDCGALAHLSLPQTTITSAKWITTGEVTMSEDAVPLKGLPQFCRVRGILRPSPDSEIHFEVWLPAKWNGNFLGVGNGGFAGSISMGGLVANLKRGYATAASDTGHQALASDASWAYQHPEKVKDFGWRALHLTTLRAKQILHAYYGKPAEESYFDSCSDGGREALMEAERFPADYNGILAGAPAANWVPMLASGLGMMQAMMTDPHAFIPELKLPAIQRASLAACDAQDGVKDGIISDPTLCHFNPETLLCKGKDSLNCLTAPQLATLKRLYSGGVQEEDGLQQGFLMGNETGWGDWVIGGDPGAAYGAQYVANYFRYMVTEDPTWNPLTANVEAVSQEAMQKTGHDLDATDPDLSRFAALGGKLILYHGWNDPAIPPSNTINYYHAVQKTMGAEKTASFVRLYMVPGMGHCVRGPGATDFGQFGIPTLPGAEHNIFTTLVDWVQKGTAPGEMVATKFGTNAQGKPAPVMTRPLCPYPEAVKYKGTGDTSKASSFACVAP